MQDDRAMMFLVYRERRFWVGGGKEKILSNAKSKTDIMIGCLFYPYPYNCHTEI